MKVPSKEEILAAVNKVKAETLTAYEDKVSDEPLISEKPQGGKITKQENGPFGSTILTLSNGVRVILKSTDFKADEIRMRAFSPGGSSLFPNDEIININVMNDVASIGGLGNFSNVDLEKVLAGKKASVSASVGGNTEGLSGSCSPKDFDWELCLLSTARKPSVTITLICAKATIRTFSAKNWKRPKPLYWLSTMVNVHIL